MILRKLSFLALACMLGMGWVEAGKKKPFGNIRKKKVRMPVPQQQNPASTITVNATAPSSSNRSSTVIRAMLEQQSAASASANSTQPSAQELYDQACKEKHQGHASEAFILFTKAAKQDHAGAQCKLGMCYLNDIGVHANQETLSRDQNTLRLREQEKKAVQWYRKAAEQDHAEAQYNLGCCYEDGIGVAKDLQQALDWYRKAADQKHMPAQKALWECYLEGKGVDKDEKTAQQWYELAYENDNDEDDEQDEQAE